MRYTPWPMPPFEHPVINGADVFIVAGDSNASGRGSRINGYSLAGLFGNDYEFKQLRDPVDSLYHQVDTVSSEPANPARGSVWPVFADDLMTDTSRAVYFVPTAKGGTVITDWLPGADHQDRSTLYGSMVYRALQVQAQGGVLRAVLFWEGANDAQAGMTQATFNGHLDTIANAVYSDLGIKLMPAKSQACVGFSVTAINAAIAEAWGDNSNVLTGPDLSGLTADNDDGLGVHLISNSNIDSAAALWLAAIETAFGW